MSTSVYAMSHSELKEYNEQKLEEFKNLFLNTDKNVDDIYAEIGVDKGSATYRYINGRRKEEGCSVKDRGVKFNIVERSSRDVQAELEEFYQEFKELWLADPKISKRKAFKILGKTQKKERVDYINIRMKDDGLEEHYPNKTVKNTKTDLGLYKTPEQAYDEYKNLFYNSYLSIKDIYEEIGVPQNQNTHYTYIRRRAEEEGLNGHARRMLLKRGGRPKGRKDYRRLSDTEKKARNDYFEEQYVVFLKYYHNLDLSVRDILKIMGTHHKSDMYFYFRERLAEDGLDPTKRQGKMLSRKIKKTYEQRRKQLEPLYEKKYQEYKELFYETELPIKDLFAELGVEPRSPCAKHIRKRAKEEGLSAHERKWIIRHGTSLKDAEKHFDEKYQEYKRLFLETDMNVTDIYKKLGVAYESHMGHYVRNRAKDDGLDSHERMARRMTMSKKSTEELEELFKKYKELFMNSKLTISDIYKTIGVKETSYEYRYIRERARNDGLDGKKRMFQLKKEKSRRKKYAPNKSKGKKRSSKYSERTIKQVENSKEILNQIFMERNIKEGTAKGYLATAYHWFELFGEKYNTIQEVVDFYIEEEDKHIPMRERTIKSDLLKFREYLINCETMHSSKSVMSYYQKFTALLRHYGLEVPVLPKAKMEKGYVSNYNDLPTHDMIRTACDQSPDVLKAVILFMSSSGSAKAETLSITIGMFLEGCSEYLQERPTPSNMRQCIDELKDRHDVVPLIYLRRIKTDKWYHTCCSPEASYMILKYLSDNAGVGWDEQLFPYGSSLLLTRFQEINDRNDWGKVGRYRRFRGHVLRKFMASNIGLPRDQVDSFQGRSKDMIQEAYFKQDPRQLKKIYLSAMHRVMIYDNWGHSIENEDLKVGEPVVEDNPNVEVIKSDNENTSSIADELLKYSKLLEKGVLSDEEFKMIKQKLLTEMLS